MKTLEYIFGSPLEFFQMADALTDNEVRKPSASRIEWNGGINFRQAMELPNTGWNPEALASKTKSLMLRAAKTKISLKKDVRGGVLLVDNYAEGNPLSFKRKVRSKGEAKRLTILVNLTESAAVKPEVMFNKAAAVATIVENLRRQKVSVSVYAFYAVKYERRDIELIEAIPIKKFTENLHMHKLGAMLHPAAFRCGYIGRTANKNEHSVPQNVLKGYGEYPIGEGRGTIDPGMFVKATEMMKSKLKEKNVMVVPSLSNYGGARNIETEKGLVEFVNYLIESANSVLAS
jgi:hypothetical protein